MKNVTANGHEFSVFNEGTGSPILFVHGFPLNHTMWQRQLDAFADSYRVIAPDLRGFGNSGVTEGTATMEQFADDLNAILDSLGITEPITFCGLSMGGYIGWQFVRKYGRRIKTLILYDTRQRPIRRKELKTVIAWRKKFWNTVRNRPSEPCSPTWFRKKLAMKNRKC